MVRNVKKFILFDSGEWTMESGEWTVDSGEWKVERSYTRNEKH